MAGQGKDVGGDCGPSTERTRKPWSAPVLTVHSVTEVTRAGSTSSRNDGTSVYAATS
jgi:hypothetical protein